MHSDYSAVIVGADFLDPNNKPAVAHLDNRGSLVSATKARFDEPTSILWLAASSEVKFTNQEGGYVGNAADPSLADPTAYAAFAKIQGTTSRRSIGVRAVEAEGEILLENYGTMVGLVGFEGSDGVEMTEAVEAIFNNMGYWYVVGADPGVFEQDPTDLLDLSSVGSLFRTDGGGGINNGGLIQTANRNGGESLTRLSRGGIGAYVPDAFFNNFFEGPSGTKLPGTISMLDGEANDETQMWGDFDGGNYAEGYGGTVAVDAFLDVDGIGASDFFSTRFDSTGSTAIYVDNINPTFGGPNTDGIDVARINPVIAGCVPYCRPGDTVYLSPESPDYAWLDDGGEGLHIIRDGLLGWVLTRHPTRFSGAQLITTTYSPDRALLPSLTSTIQNLWYDTDGIVQSQLDMLNSANGPGGGGADIPAGYDFLDADPAPASHGIWLRASGNWTQEDSQVSDGMFTYDTSFDQDTYSIIAGADMKFDPDSPFRFGLFGGYVTSQVNFDGYDIDTDYEGGTFGAYAAYVAGGFSVDATLKVDLVEASYESTAGDVNADVVNVGVRANTGYRFDGSMGFIEPIASFAYVNSQIDDMDFGVTTVDFSNGQSLRAGVGARFGTAFGAPNGGSTEVSLVGRLWNEFEDENTVTISNGTTQSYTDSISGVFGEVAATAAMTAADGLTSGFLSAGAEFNDEFTSYSAKAGMRRAW